MNRRSFLMSSVGALGAASSVFSAPVEAVRVACVGIGRRGLRHVTEYAALPRVEVAALCDMDATRLDLAVTMLQRFGKRRPAVYNDIRTLLEDAELDAVSITLPDYWIPLATAWACQAGKDAFVDPSSPPTFVHAQQMLAAARRHGRVVQLARRGRSSLATRDAVAQMRRGVLGDVRLVRALACARRWRWFRCIADDARPNDEKDQEPCHALSMPDGERYEARKRCTCRCEMPRISAVSRRLRPMRASWRAARIVAWLAVRAASTAVVRASVTAAAAWVTALGHWCSRTNWSGSWSSQRASASSMRSPAWCRVRP